MKTILSFVVDKNTGRPQKRQDRKLQAISFENRKLQVISFEIENHKQFRLRIENSKKFRLRIENSKQLRLRIEKINKTHEKLMSRRRSWQNLQKSAEWHEIYIHKSQTKTSINTLKKIRLKYAKKKQSWRCEQLEESDIQW